MPDDNENRDAWNDWCDRASDNLDAGSCIINSLHAAQASIDAVSWPLIEYVNSTPTDRISEKEILPKLRAIAAKAEEMALAIENRRGREE